MKIRLIRHATLMLEVGGQRLLVDPMLAEPGQYPSLTLGDGSGRNPTAPLPCGLDELTPHGLLVTHRHFDHWDKVARNHFSRGLPLLCPDWDASRHQKEGWRNVFPVGARPTAWRGIQLERIGGRHGTGLVGLAMGKVAGFLISTPLELTTYVVGDTRWCPEVAATLERHQPQVVVVNAGAARFNLGERITMDAAEVALVARAVPHATVVAVHLDAVNHCRQSRRELAAHLASEGLAERVLIPRDGEILAFPNRPIERSDSQRTESIGTR